MENDFSDLERPENRVHPNQALIFVKNESDEAYTWVANSIPVTIAPRATVRIPRWAFHLGCKYPASPVVEVSPKEGTVEYEQSLLAQRKLEVQRAKEALALKQAEFQEADKRFKVANANVTAGMKDPAAEEAEAAAAAEAQRKAEAQAEAKKVK